MNFQFSQNEKLKRVIMRTHPKILVEASPHDKIWGIGLDKDDERAWRKATWQGTNFLGYILTEVRDEIMARDKLIDEKSKKVNSNFSYNTFVCLPNLYPGNEVSHIKWLKIRSVKFSVNSFICCLYRENFKMT